MNTNLNSNNRNGNGNGNEEEEDASNELDVNFFDNANEITLTPTIAQLHNNNNNNENADDNNQNANDNNTVRNANRELWMEHERRQRTIRFLMIFLMMLILMDGEQQSQMEQMEKHKSHLRKRHNATTASALQQENHENLSPEMMMNGTNGHSLLSKRLFQQRHALDIQLENRVYNTKSNSRIKALLELNANNIHHEQQPQTTTESQHPHSASSSSLSSSPFMEQEIWNQMERRHQGELNHGANIAGTVENERDDENEHQQQKVYHYPRNTTGHYRGYWTRIPSGYTRLSSSLVSSLSQNLTVTTTTPTTTDSIEIATATTSLQRKKKVIIHSKSIQDIIQEYNLQSRHMNGDLVDNNVQQQQQQYDDNEEIGVFLTPPGIQLYGNKKKQLELLVPNNGEDGKYQSYINTNNNNNDDDADVIHANTTTATTAINNTPNNSNNSDQEENLYITESTGRIHFQFYSRPIRAMKHLSLIDGYVKIRDLNDLGFTNTKKHLFIRVHGVYIHAIGKVSLVSNDGLLQSVFSMVGDDHNGGGKDKKEQELKRYQQCETKNGYTATATSTSETSKSTRRRLQASIVELESLLPSGGGISNSRTHGALHQKILLDIRNRALFLYAELFNVHQIGGHEWKLFSSNVIDEHDLDEDEKERGEDNQQQQHRDFHRRKLLEEINNTEGDSSNDNKDNSHERKEEEQEEDCKSEYWFRSTTLTYPYVPYDQNTTKLSNGATFDRMFSNIPEVLFNNYCQFEINLNVNATSWTLKEWYDMARKKINDINSVNPFYQPKPANFTDGEKEEEEESLESNNGQEALVMDLTGTMDSPNCDFAITLNATAVRTDWEKTKYKSSVYSVYMMITTMTQIVVLLRQIIYAQSSMALTRVSLICIGWQTVLDAIFCIEHVMLCLMVPPVSTAFFLVALLQFLLFYVIEMKYMAMIIEARSSAAGLSTSASEIRRRFASLQLRFYAVLIFTITAFWYLIIGQYRRKLVFFIMFSFWVPQIIYNVITESKKPLHKHYIYGNSMTRLSIPLILFGIPKSFMQEIEPEFPLDFTLCWMILVWIGIQTALLIAQSKYGTRFMIPARFLPPKYNYSRPIPSCLLPSQISNSSDESDSGTLLENDVMNDTKKGPRNRKEKRSHNSDGNGITTVHEEEGDRPTLDCVICHGPIDAMDRRAYMLAPCDHVFHRNCLEQWMDVKMECPICRTALPAL